MTTITISEKGQISIPASIRRHYGLKKGDKLAVEVHKGAIVLRPLPRHPLLSLMGKYGRENEESMTALLLKERKSERERDKY